MKQMRLVKMLRKQSKMRKRLKEKSEMLSDKSPPVSLSCHSSTVCAHLTSSFTPTVTQRFQLFGAKVVLAIFQIQRKLSSVVSAQLSTRWRRLLVIKQICKENLYRDAAQEEIKTDSSYSQIILN